MRLDPPRSWPKVMAGLLLLVLPVAVAATWVAIAWGQSRWPTLDAVVVSSDRAAKGPSSAVVSYELDGRTYRAQLRGSYVAQGATVTVGIDPDDVGTVAPAGGFWYQLWLLAVPAAITTGLAAGLGYLGIPLVRTQWESRRVTTGSRGGHDDRPGRTVRRAPGDVAVVAELAGVSGELQAAFGVPRRKLGAALDAALAPAQRGFLARARTTGGTSAATAPAWWAFVPTGDDLVVVLAEVGRPCGITVDGDGVSAEATASLRSALASVHPALGAAEVVLYTDADLVDPGVPSEVDAPH